MLERIKEAISSRKASTISPSLVTVSSVSEFEYYGKSIAVGDWNGDGINDVAIGAPGYTKISSGGRSLGNSQSGRVYIEYGPFDLAAVNPVTFIYILNKCHFLNYS